MKHFEITGVVGLARTWMLLLVCLAGTHSFAQGPPPQAVRVDPVRVEPLRNHRLVTGELRAWRRSEVTGQEPGLVMELRVMEGQTVKMGDVLARLDSSRLEIEKKEVQANLSVTQARIEQYQAELELYAWQQEVYQKLLESGSGRELELRQAQSNQAATQARITQARMQVEVYQAQLALLDQRIGDMVITAPFDASVVRRQTEAGQWLNAGDPVAELVSVGRIDVWLEIPEELSVSVSAAKGPIRIAVVSVGRQYEVSSPRIVREVNAQTRTFSLVATLDDDKTLLKPGMSIVGWAPTGQTGDYLTVSSDAIRRNNAGVFVFVVRKGSDGAPDMAVLVAVRIRFYHDDRVAVESDELMAGDQLVVEGSERLMPGAPVVVAKESQRMRNDHAMFDIDASRSDANRQD